MIEAADPFVVVVGNERRDDPVLFKGCKPRKDPFVRFGLLVGSEGVVDIEDQGANPVLQQKFGRYVVELFKVPLGGKIASEQNGRPLSLRFNLL